MIQPGRRDITARVVPTERVVLTGPEIEARRRELRRVETAQREVERVEAERAKVIEKVEAEAEREEAAWKAARVEVADDKWMLKEDFEALTPEEQKIAKEEGVEALSVKGLTAEQRFEKYVERGRIPIGAEFVGEVDGEITYHTLEQIEEREEWEARHVEGAKGEWITKEAFEEMSLEARETFETEGLQELRKEVAVEAREWQERIARGEVVSIAAGEYMEREVYEALKPAMQLIAVTEGLEALSVEGLTPEQKFDKYVEWGIIDKDSKYAGESEETPGEPAYWTPEQAERLGEIEAVEAKRLAEQQAYEAKSYWGRLGEEFASLVGYGSRETILEEIGTLGEFFAVEVPQQISESLATVHRGLDEWEQEMHRQSVTGTAGKIDRAATTVAVSVLKGVSDFGGGILGFAGTVLGLPLVAVEEPEVAGMLAVGTVVGMAQWGKETAINVVKSPLTGIPYAAYTLLPMVGGAIGGVKYTIMRGKKVYAYVHPKGQPPRMLAIEADVSRMRVPEALTNKQAEAIIERAVTDQVTGKIRPGMTRTAEVPGVGEVTYRVVPQQVGTPDVLYHGTPDVGAFVSKWRAGADLASMVSEGRGLFTSPQAAMDFIAGAAGKKIPPVDPGVVAIRISPSEFVSLTKGPYKTYRGAIEAERVVTPGVELYVTQADWWSRHFGKTKGATGETFTVYEGPTVKITGMPGPRVAPEYVGVTATLRTGQSVPVVWLRTAGGAATPPAVGMQYSLKLLTLWETLRDLPYIRLKKVEIGWGEPAASPFRSGRKAYGDIKAYSDAVVAEAMRVAKERVAKGEVFEKAFAEELQRLFGDESTKVIDAAGGSARVAEAIRGDPGYFANRYAIHASTLLAQISAVGEGTFAEYANPEEVVVEAKEVLSMAEERVVPVTERVALPAEPEVPVERLMIPELVVPEIALEERVVPTEERVVPVEERIVVVEERPPALEMPRLEVPEILMPSIEVPRLVPRERVPFEPRRRPPLEEERRPPPLEEEEVFRPMIPSPEEEKKVEKERVYLEDSVAWRQGLAWIVVEPPYTEENMSWSDRPPKDVYQADVGLPGETVRGPDVTFTVPVGMFDVIYSRGTLEYRRQPAQRVSLEEELEALAEEGADELMEGMTEKEVDRALRELRRGTGNAGPYKQVKKKKRKPQVAVGLSSVKQ